MTSELSRIEQRLRDAFSASEKFAQQWTDESGPSTQRVSRRVRWIAPAIAAAGVVMVAIAIVILSPGSSPKGSGEQAGALPTVAPAMPSSTVTIDPFNHEMFVPASVANAGTLASLSGDEAWRRYAVSNGSTVFSPPQGVTVALGYLTLPRGGGQPDVAHNQMVWAYSWNDECPLNTNPLHSPPPARACIAWLFLDASTGAQIDQTWQQ